MNRLLRLLLLLVLPHLMLASGDGVQILRIGSGWREAGSFKRISEYFDGRENTGGQIILRTSPESRGGYYFHLRLANPGHPLVAHFNLRIITGANAKPVVHRFTTDLKSGDSLILLGLTGTDWPDAKANPVAWKLEISDADDRLLATEQSYLWEKPEE